MSWRKKRNKRAQERKEREGEKITIPYAIRGWPDAASCARSDHRFLPSFLPSLLPSSTEIAPRALQTNRAATRKLAFPLSSGSWPNFSPISSSFDHASESRFFFLPFLSPSLLATLPPFFRVGTSRRAHFSSSWDADPGNLVLGLLSSSLLSFLRDAWLPCTRTLNSLSPSLCSPSLSLAPSLSAHHESCYSRIPVA